MTLRWPAVPDEIRQGWPIILGASLGIASGVAILFLSFSIFVIPLSQELGVTRGDLGKVQALIIMAALGSPIIGRFTDMFGVKRVYVACSLIVAGVHFWAALFATTITHLAVTIALVGFFGAGSGTVVLSRPIGAHFREHRGLALGLMAMGISVLAIIAPQLIKLVMAWGGWRGTFMAMAAVSVFIGIPAVLLLVPDNMLSGSGIGMITKSGPAADWRFIRTRDFWLLTLSLITMSLATAGAGNQMYPMVFDASGSADTATLALSFFAAGTFVGRLGGGWLLDRFEPRRVGFLLTLVPALGFVILLTAAGSTPAILLAVAIIGVQQGAEIDIFAYFVARRFAIAQYSAIYGTLVGLGWIGNVGGLVGMGQSYDIFGTYAPGQIAAIFALAVSSVLLLLVRLPSRHTEISGGPE